MALKFGRFEMKKESTKGHTLRSAARAIGVSAGTLARWIDDGEGPKAFVKMGVKRNTIRITDSNLKAYLNRNSRGGTAEDR
jgi:predicted site-specific integrase-resolvase